MGKHHSESPFRRAQCRERFQQTARMSAIGSWWMMGGRREAERSGRRFRLSSQQFNGKNTCMGFNHSGLIAHLGYSHITLEKELQSNTGRGQWINDVPDLALYISHDPQKTHTVTRSFHGHVEGLQDLWWFFLFFCYTLVMNDLISS